MNGYTSDQVYNGTYGEVWVNGNYLAETKSFRAEVNCNYEAVPQARARILRLSEKSTIRVQSDRNGLRCIIANSQR